MFYDYQTVKIDNSSLLSNLETCTNIALPVEDILLCSHPSLVLITSWKRLILWPDFTYYYYNFLCLLWLVTFLSFFNILLSGDECCFSLPMTDTLKQRKGKSFHISPSTSQQHYISKHFAFCFFFSVKFVHSWEKLYVSSFDGSIIQSLKLLLKSCSLTIILLQPYKLVISSC